MGVIQLHYRLSISKEHLNKLQAYAEAKLPYESVALLFGGKDGKRIEVKTINLVENISSAPKTEFSVEPEEEYKLLLKAEERDEHLVAIFHSHTAPPYPSEKDLDNMRLNQVVWLIASRCSGTWKTKAFLLVDNQLEEIALEVL